MKEIHINSAILDIEKINGKGLMLGLTCKVSSVELNKKAREKGLLLVPAANNVLRVLPPLNVKIGEIRIALKTLDHCLREIN